MTNEAGKVRRFRFGIPGRDSGTLVSHDDGAYMYYTDYEAGERRRVELVEAAKALLVSQYIHKCSSDVVDRCQCWMCAGSRLSALITAQESAG